MSMKRLRKEYKVIMADHQYNIECQDDLRKWKCYLPGPKNTIYSNYIFEIDILIPEEYPFKAPDHLFITPIIHPNIANNKACLKIVQNWSPEYKILDIINEINSLLLKPRWNERLHHEPSDPSEFMSNANIKLKNILL
jgi:ubiquitin-conjugating enzyme E2 N